MPAKAPHRVSLQLKWLHQAQFAGYYVAEEKGYFAEEGLEVDIKPGGAHVDPEKLIARDRGFCAGRGHRKSARSTGHWAACRRDWRGVPEDRCRLHCKASIWDHQAHLPLST